MTLTVQLTALTLMIANAGALKVALAVRTQPTQEHAMMELIMIAMGPLMHRKEGHYAQKEAVMKQPTRSGAAMTLEITMETLTLTLMMMGAVTYAIQEAHILTLPMGLLAKSLDAAALQGFSQAGIQEHLLAAAEMMLLMNSI
jgi:hypothetical protein